MSVLLGISAVAAIMFVTYKPVYKVYVDGEEKGYIASKVGMEKAINNFVLNGDADNVAYVTLNSKIDYELMLVKKEINLTDTEVYAYIKDCCDVYYKVYAVKVGDEEKCIVESKEDAETMVNNINEQQKKFTKQTEAEVVEKILQEYESVSDIEVAVADIMKPLQKANDEIISKRVKTASSKSVSKEVLEALKNSLIDLDFQKPVENGIITSKYGWRSMGYHYGLDIGVATGTPIHASESGVVTYSAWCGNYGYLIKVQHSGGYETYYAHCSKLVAEVGDEVAQGDVIAYVGSTGRSTGPHVHLEVRYEGKTLDPEVFVYNK